VYGGQKLSVYEKAVLELLKNGPKQRKEIVKQLCPKIMSIKKLQNTLNLLVSEGKLKAVSKRMEGSRRWTTWYTLPKHEYLLEVDAGRVVAAIERLWKILLRPPTVQEIAVETGITPQGAEKLAYKLADETGWFPPKPELVKDAAERLGEVLVCAARIRDEKVSNFTYEDDPETMEKAKQFLKEHPEMLPKLDKYGEKVVYWPPEALKYLGKWYEPKDRIRPYFGVAYPKR
jgi:hypothetical protein